MSLASFIFLLACFWGFINWKRRQAAQSASVLPFAHNYTPRTGNDIIYQGSWTTIQCIPPVILRIKTSKLVGAHKGLVEFLNQGSRGLLSDSRRRSKGIDWQKITFLFYDVGSVCAIAGQIIATLFLPWLLIHMGKSIISPHLASEEFVQPNSITLHKRNPGIPSTPSGVSALQPLIPGITIPFSHVYPILLSIIGCTFFHELGHALAAAAEGIPLASWGYSLILAIPAAFVELGASDKERAPRSRLRVASAGSYHNLLILLLTFLLSTLPLNTIFIYILGYKRADSGVVIYNIRDDSPLHDFMLPGSIITQLDDAKLTNSPNVTAQDLWSSYLLPDSLDPSQKVHDGWCMQSSSFNALKNDCCTVSQDPFHTSLGSCFVPLSTLPIDEPTRGRCLDPLSLFENTTAPRCASDSQCAAGFTCIRPSQSELLLRIVVKFPEKGSKDEVIVWRGPRREVWEQVTVGEYYRARGYFPLGLPYQLDLLLHYIKTVTISLFFFNLLPLRMLDGSEILAALLALPLLSQSAGHDEDIDLELGRSVDGGMFSGRPARQAHTVQAAIEKVTMGFIGLNLVGMLISGWG